MSDKKKVLIIKLTSLGDVIFNIPLANSLKDAGYEESWLVSSKGYDVVNNNPAVSKTYLAPDIKWEISITGIKNFIEYIKLIRKIRKEKFDIVIDAQRMLKSMIWQLFSGAKRRITYTGAKELSWLGINEFVPKSFIQGGHSVDKYLGFARYLGIEPEYKFTLPPSTKETKEKIDTLLTDTDKTKPIVVISPATTRHLKFWHNDNWKKLINGIKDICNLVFTATKNDRALIDAIGGNKFIDLTGKTTIADLIELFSRAAIVISPDAGSSHIAWACGIPAVISIFTITPPHLYGPFGDDKKYFRVIGNLPCQPCYKQKCPLKQSEFEACRRLPDAGEIINIVNNLLKTANNSV